MNRCYEMEVPDEHMKVDKDPTPKPGVANEIPIAPYYSIPELPDWNKELELLLTTPESLPIHDFTKCQRFWGRKANPDALFHMDLCPVQTTIRVERNPTTGQLLGYKEEYISDCGHGAQNSLSLARAPGSSSQDLKGSSLNFPFWPGGLDEPEIKSSGNLETSLDLDFQKDLLIAAPGLQSGVDFHADQNTAVGKSTGSQRPTENASSIIKLVDIFAEGDDMLDFDIVEGEELQPTEQEESQPNIALTRSESLEEIVNIEWQMDEAATPTVVYQATPKEEWAVKVNVQDPVADFHLRVPNMAYKWPFELDTFQKQAVLYLERHESVFVSAHTSAGKTVVAEYAIALSMKHMTKTVYTSPIKALSNQKYRDFRKTFTDVGLITGDVQINQKAACLIMTTEILRSMLYNGSEVIRDLEWVIFDEVHYINDSERGVVWEEVLIMLPSHVNIILLSATVPNTMEFADWVGRIKKKKIYVISTTKRPVPLEHFLFTGNSNKTSEELFLILDSKRLFQPMGYQKAVDAKKDRSSKSAQNFGPKGTRSGHPSHDKNIMLSVVEMLRKKDKLPAVMFTFSKKKIEENARHLQSKDLLTAAEKSKIHFFFHKCITRLSKNDQKLPQVQQMENRLKQGIGVHHSGVLPILKEVVEMLFQDGLVKVLFATETFAMGVNMPARTVVFTNIQKHDGKSFRDLLPGEYVQMAGRAGRRGLDKTGTVIILCSGDVPDQPTLHTLLLGRPTLLESQFRLTYTMILNLLKVEQLRVEDMMKRSFSEFHTQKDDQKYKEMLEELSKKIDELQPIDCFMYCSDIEEYYNACMAYQSLKAELQTVVLSHPAAIKALSPGRIVVVCTNKHINVLGVILQSHISGTNERTFTAMVICEKNVNDSSAENEINDRDSLMQSPILNNQLFRPEGTCWHEVIKLKPEELRSITTRTLKVEPDRIINDVKKREQERFRDDLPSQSVSVTSQELLRLTESNPDGLPSLDPVKDLHVRDIELVEKFRSLNFQERSFSNFQCIHCPQFTEHYAEVCRQMELKNEYKKVQYKLSDESLQLLPEYQQRIQVLKILGYIDENCIVKMKGLIARDISTQQLLIVELILENVLSELHPTEIAALLSCVVFQQKHCRDPELTDTLIQAKEKTLAIAEHIGQVQKQCGLKIPIEDYKDEFNFALMQVVFEWARGMPFSKITELTEVQEGIIVRTIQRLHEILRDVCGVARVVGDTVLAQKLEEASTSIKRDIVFAGSLYLQ